MNSRTAELIEVLLVLIFWLLMICGVVVFFLGVIVGHVPSMLIGLASGIGGLCALAHYVNHGFEFLSEREEDF